MNLNLTKTLSYLVVLLTLVSMNQWSLIHIGNTTTSWVLYLVITFLFITLQKTYYNSSNARNLVFLKIYLAWVVISIVRGFFVAEYYWDYKSLIHSGFALLMPISIFILMHPKLTKEVLYRWFLLALPLFLVYSILIETGSYGRYLIPVSFLGLFLLLLPKKWKIIVLLVSLFVVVINLDARSNVIKFGVTLLFSGLLFFPKLVHSKWLKMGFKFFFLLPIILLVLGLTNTFNVFKLDEYIEGDYMETVIVDNEEKEVSLKADTRTFLYIEVLQSALNNNYVIFGRTPARGNDSSHFGSHAAEELGTGRYERYSNEVSILNIFTWLGIIGVLLYLLVYYKAAHLAIYQSNNVYLKMLGLYVAFRWAYVWVEDPNRFDIMNLMLWIVVAMCYSKQFRQMNDTEFKLWFNSLLPFERKRIKLKKITNTTT